MACSVVRVPVLRNSAVRHYATAAATQCAATSANDIQVLHNKITVAAIDNNSPIARVSIIFRTGSRNETYEIQGTSHMLRLATGLGTNRSSCFGITRNIQQLGGNLFATSDRESIAYTLQITRDHLGETLKFLEDVATQQVFKPWEISDQIPRLRYELSTIPDTVRIVEILHKAAYHNGLGNSLYCPKQHVGKINSENLQHFVNTWFLGSRCAVVATGVPLSEVNYFAENLCVGSEEINNDPSKYCGGEIRKDRNSALANVAVAVEGASLNKEKDVIALAVLQRAAGTGPHIKWGSSTSPLYKLASSAAGSDPFAISAFNVNYTDSGLFGFILSAPGHIAGSLTKAAHDWLRSPKLADADITRGKTELKAAVWTAAENSSTLIEDLGQEVLLKGRILSPAATIAEIDKITPADVKNVTSKFSSSKLSVAAIGNLCTVPYIDQLR